MSARAVAYPPPGCKVRIPRPLLNRGFETMRRYGQPDPTSGIRGSEGLVYYAGLVVGDELVATSLYELDHDAQGDRVVVGPEEARWLLRTLRSRDEKLIAQMHSHRTYAGHSLGDDQHATSFHEGFLSIVVPFFGSSVEELDECVVLEFRAGDFVELTPEQLAARISVFDPIVSRLPRAPEQRKEGWWHRFARRLRLTAPSRR